MIDKTIQSLKERPILELDELWSFVGSKKQKVWIWLALERQTRRIVGLAFGGRDEKLVENYGKAFHLITGKELFYIQTIGIVTMLCYLLRGIEQLIKHLEKLIILKGLIIESLHN